MKNYQAKILMGSLVAIHANQIDQKASTDLQSQQKASAEQQAQWGFLKNIVNIDSFFSSGKEPSGGKKTQVKKSSKIQKKASKKESTSADFNTEEITLTDKKKTADKGSMAQVVKDSAKKVKKNETKKATAQKPKAVKKETKAAPAKKEVDPLEQEMMDDITGAKTAVKETKKPAETPKKKAVAKPKSAKKTVQKEAQASADEVGGVAEDSLEDQEKILNKNKPKKEVKKEKKKEKEVKKEKPAKKKQEVAPEKDESLDEEAIKAAASMAVDGEETPEDNSDQQNAQFEEPAEFVVLSAKDASDTTKELKTQSKKINSQSEANEFFKGVKGQKIMFVNGQLYKTNVDSGENAYYRLVGEAYNNKKLNRAQLSSDAAKPGSSFYTYIVDGSPQTMEHSAENDKKYGYSKQVFNKVNTSGDSLAQTNGSSKLFSASCNKLKYNSSKDRLNQCNLASGYFIVHEQQLYMEPASKDLSDYGIKVAE